MRILRTIVEAATDLVSIGEADLLHRRGIHRTSIGDDAARRALFLHNPLEKLERCWRRWSPQSGTRLRPEGVSQAGWALARCRRSVAFLAAGSLVFKRTTLKPAGGPERLIVNGAPEEIRTPDPQIRSLIGPAPKICAPAGKKDWHSDRNRACVWTSEGS